MASKLEQLKLLELEKQLSLLDRQWKQVSDTAYKVLRKAEKEVGPKDKWSIYTIKHLEPFLVVAPDMYPEKVSKDINELRNITSRLNTQGRKNPPVIDNPDLVNHLLEYFKNKVLKEKLEISKKIESKKKETSKISNPLSHGGLFRQMSGLDTNEAGGFASMKDRINDSLGVERGASLWDNRKSVAKKVAGKSVGGLMHFAGLMFDSPGLNMLASSYNTKYNAVMEKRDQAEIAIKKRDMEADMEISSHREFLNAGKLGQKDISDVSKSAKTKSSNYSTAPYAFAGGGSFVTKGKQNITVGDNPGGAERVDVTPLSGIGKTTGPGVSSNGEGQVVRAIKENTLILKQMLSIDQMRWAEEEDADLNSSASTIKNADTSNLNVIKAEQKKQNPSTMMENLKNNLIDRITPRTPAQMMKVGGTVAGAGIGGYGGYKAGSGLAEMLGAEEGGTMSKIAGGVGGAAGAIGGGILGNKLGGRFAKSKMGGMLGGLMSPKEGTPVYVTNASEIASDGGGVGDKIGSKMGGKFGSKMMGKGAGLLGKAGGMLGGLSKFAGPIGLAITAGMALKGGVSGFGNAENIAQTGGKKATGLQKVGAGAAGAMSSLTMGLVKPEMIYKGLAGMAELSPAGLLFNMWKGMSEDSGEQTGLLGRIKSGFSGAKESYQASRDKGGGRVEALLAAGKGAISGLKGTNTAREKSLEAAATKAGITDPKEKAAFMGQMSHESGGFTQMSEGKYSADKVWEMRGSTLARKGVTKEQLQAEEKSGGKSKMYEYMYGDKYREGGAKMGNTEAGDGEKYKGRGFVQLTGKSNYADMTQRLKKEGVNVDLVKNPEMAEDPEIAAKIATIFWKKSGAGDAAKAGNAYGTTQAINGGQNGAQDRASRTLAYEKRYGTNPGDTNVAQNVNAKSPTSSVVPPTVAKGADTTKVAAAQQYNTSPTTQMAQKVAEEKARKEFFAKESAKPSMSQVAINTTTGGSQAPRGPIYTGDNASFPARMSRAVS